MASQKEEELRARPCFEEWCDNKIKNREDYVVLRTNVVYYGVMSNLTFCRTVLISLAKENNGMVKEDSPEFRKIQAEWWHYYRKIMVLRSFLVRYFDIPTPDWLNELLPERLYCGVLLSEEDFLKFITAEGSGIKLEKQETPEDYGQKLKDNRMQNRTDRKAMEAEFTKEKEDDEV